MVGSAGHRPTPFVLHPTVLSPPDAPIVTSVGLHRVLKTWLAEVGQPVRCPWLEDRLEQPSL